jgi:hypothetical protein
MRGTGVRCTCDFTCANYRLRAHSYKQDTDCTENSKDTA